MVLPDRAHHVGGKTPALTAVAAGAYTGTTPIAVVRRWERCSPACAPITGATRATYTLTAADVGSSVRVVESATNEATTLGSLPAVKTPSGQLGPVVAAIAPPTRVGARAGDDENVLGHGRREVRVCCRRRRLRGV